MKRRLRIISILLLIIFAFIACSGEEHADQGKVEDSGTEKPSAEDKDQEKEKITLTYMYPLTGEALLIVEEDLNEALIMPIVEEKTGVHMEFIHQPDGDGGEQYSLMLATDDLPDIITHGAGIPAGYPGGGDKAIEDGIYLKLNDLVDHHAPNFKRIMEEDDDLRRDIFTDAGNIWGIPMVDIEAQKPFTGPIIRKDILEELNLEMPETMDEWYNVLTKMKNEKGIEVPFNLVPGGIPADNAFIGAYGVNGSFFQIDNDVKFGPMEPGYKEYLQEMNKWYEEGLIAEDFASWDGEKRVQYFTTGKTAAGAHGQWIFEPWREESGDPNFLINAAPYPSLNKGEKPHFRQGNIRMRGYHTAITTACEHPDRAMEWIDFFFSEEGSILANYGIEDETYVKDGDSYKYTDLVLDNPEGVSANVAYYKYSFAHGAFFRDINRAFQLYADYEMDAWDVWENSADTAYAMPAIQLTAEEGVEIGEIMEEVNGYVNSKRIEFITGETPLESFDEYVDNIKKMNIDRAIEIQQDALVRYNAR